ncbi:hypothetical protein B0H17DRAFT_466107 [Mycena rosella]|uniref:F-box domain-containing protein n=1 Tax=Mycena rosella TaxID=1033263 RepID=A0AAD7DL88_MYCRO|nr:hypothetical protein B0H17DRAFT_466107 [Mycena rosella]
MAPNPIPPDICREIALLSSRREVAALSLVSSWCSSILSPVLYRNITIGDGSRGLIKTLARVPEKAILVRSLIFHGSRCVYIDDDEWAQALTLLINLHHLTVTHHVPMAWTSLPFIRFRLRSFTSSALLVGAWVGFLHLQPDLQALCLHSDLLGQIPGPDVLPALRRLTGRIEELSKFASVHPLESLGFRIGPSWAVGLKARDIERFQSGPTRLVTLRVCSAVLCRLFRDVPAILGTLKDLALDEDQSWSRNPVTGQRTLLRAAGAFAIHTPALRSLTLVCSPSNRPLTGCDSVLIDKADEFSSAIWRKCSTSPRLDTFHFCASDVGRTYR